MKYAFDSIDDITKIIDEQQYIAYLEVAKNLIETDPSTTSFDGAILSKLVDVIVEYEKIKYPFEAND
jgi:hypothetical protein